jgi:uncharacterized protein YegL
MKGELMVYARANGERRRLPVFFLLDTSKEMDGAFEVTMQEGLLALKHELERTQKAMVSPMIYLSAITLGDQQIYHPLQPPKRFAPPLWQARGQCRLQPALARLTYIFDHALISTRPEKVGDYNPLIFFILGSRLYDSWQSTLETFVTAYLDNRRPVLITLITRPKLVPEMKRFSYKLLQFESMEAINMTKFFNWVIQAIADIAENYRNGINQIRLPYLPYGITEAP